MGSRSIVDDAFDIDIKSGNRASVVGYVLQSQSVSRGILGEATTGEF